jgi:hypothetical protein
MLIAFYYPVLLKSNLLEKFAVSKSPQNICVLLNVSLPAAQRQDIV